MTQMSETEFEAFLGAQFKAAERESGQDAEAFARGVRQRLARPDRRRFLILAGAAAAGAMVAATQLERLFDLLPVSAIEGLPGAVTPQTLALTCMAALISGFALMVQRRVI